MLITRPLELTDEPFVSDLLERDPVHKENGLKWQDVIASGTVAEVVSDESGNILAVIRYHLALRAAFQFTDETYKIAKHGTELKELLQARAKKVGATEVVIRPGGKAVPFADKLGFIDFTGSKIVGV